MDRKNRRIIAMAVLGVLILQIIITAVKYVQSYYNLDNPLIPEMLIVAIRNYSLTVISIYVIAVFSNLLYLFKDRFFWFAMIISFLALASVALFAHKITEYYLQVK
jgi:hypothetical protein